MSTTSKSPRSILVTAHGVAKASLPAFSHLNSPKTYTQHQIFACLALKSAMALDYRGIAGLLADCPELRSAIAMSRAPHWTTLQKAAERLLHSAATAALLDATFAPRPRRRTRRSRRLVAIAAVDSTRARKAIRGPERR
jgi:hypothetical protein